MAFVDEKYFKKDGDYIKFIGPYMEAFIPAYFFSKGLAQEIGDNIKTMGIFNVITYNDIDGKSANPIRLFNIPGEIMTYPSIIEVKTLDINGTGEEEVFTVLKYYENDLFCPSAIPNKTAYFKSFLEILTGGKIPHSVSYDDIYNILARNMEVSGLNYDVSDTTYETVISEIYRNKNKPEERFGIVVGKDPKHSMYDYRTASPREITKYNSTFTGFTFENMDEMLLSGVNASNSNRKENESPMEKVFKY